MVPTRMSGVVEPIGFRMENPTLPERPGRFGGRVKGPHQLREVAFAHWLQVLAINSVSWHVHAKRREPPAAATADADRLIRSLLGGHHVDAGL